MAGLRAMACGRRGLLSLINLFPSLSGEGCTKQETKEQEKMGEVLGISTTNPGRG